MFKTNIGMPQVGAERIAQNRVICTSGYKHFKPAGAIIDGTLTRDPNNDDPTHLRAGLIMGKVTSGGKYANSVIGVTAGALTNTGTSVTLTAAEAAELVRRVGSTGTFKLLGPPTAAGTVRALTVTYSAVVPSTGVVTITALGVNEVQTVNLSTAATAGNLRLLVPKTDGTTALTPNVAWSATDATLLSNLNTALDTATGVSGGIVATAISAVDTDLGFVLTYSGTGYAGLSWPLAVVDTMFTSNTGANVVRTTTGVDGRFVAGSFATPTDGSEIPVSFIGDGWGEYLGTTPSDIPWGYVPIEGAIEGTQLLPWPADASLKQYVRDKIKAIGLFAFTDQF